MSKAKQDPATSEQEQVTTQPPAAVPAWQEPDYSGPMTGEQAQWRLRHLKPAQAGAEK